MLTEDDLRELIESAAAEAPTPSPLPDGLFHVEDRQPSIARNRRRGRRGRQLGIAAVALVVVGAVAAVVPGDQIPFLEQHVIGGGESQSVETVTRSVSASGSSATGTGTAAGTGAGTLGPAGAETGAGGAGGGASAGGAAVPAGVSPAPAQTATAVAPVDSARIIKNGSLEIGVGKGTVTESVNRLTALATGLGGYVSDTRTNASTQAGAQASATISVRVPSAAFEQLMSDASKLGEVRATTTSGVDVTAQFTDIDAQLTALNATRDQFLLVLGEAKNVNDILAVQDRITQVQVQIDQLEGQKRLLTDQTSFGTLSVTLLEPGATVAVPPITDNNKDLGDAWRDARRNFGDGVESIVSASGTVALLVICGGALFGGAWLIYRRMRRQII